MKDKLTLEQRMWNAWSSNECERLHCIHQVLVAANRYPEDHSLIWDHSDECGWGYHWGWVMGWKELSYSMYSQLQTRQLDHNIQTVIKRPECMGVEPIIQDFSEYNELNSGVVEVAKDGKSARSCFVCTGMCLIPYCPEDDTIWGEFTIERYGSDYIYDENDGHWKYLHEQVMCDTWPANDFDVGNISYDAYLKLRNTGRAYNEDIYEGLGGPPRSYRHVMYDSMMPSTVRPTQNTIYPPAPYDTFGPENSYLPKDAVLDPDVFYKNEKGFWTFNIEKCNDEFFTRTAAAGELATKSIYNEHDDI